MALVEQLVADYMNSALELPLQQAIADSLLEQHPHLARELVQRALLETHRCRAACMASLLNERPIHPSWLLRDLHSFHSLLL
jgi:hypothetical protein